MGVGLGQDLERASLQCVAGQDSRRLIKRLMCARLATPQIVIVHGRQVVMHQ